MSLFSRKINMEIGSERIESPTLALRHVARKSILIDSANAFEFVFKLKTLWFIYVIWSLMEWRRVWMDDNVFGFHAVWYSSLCTKTNTHLYFMIEMNAFACCFICNASKRLLPHPMCSHMNKKKTIYMNNKICCRKKKRSIQPSKILEYFGH